MWLRFMYHLLLLDLFWKRLMNSLVIAITEGIPVRIWQGGHACYFPNSFDWTKLPRDYHLECKIGIMPLLSINLVRWALYPVRNIDLRSCLANHLGMARTVDLYWYRRDPINGTSHLDAVKLFMRILTPRRSF